MAGLSLAPSAFWLHAKRAQPLEGAWIRDNRREIYDRYLTYAEKLLHSCEAYKAAHHDKEKAKANVEHAFTNFWEVYGVVQTVACTRLVKAARIHGYRLGELATTWTLTAVIGPEDFTMVIDSFETLVMT